MKQQRYITKSETEKCKKVVQAFNEFYNQTDIYVLDTGKYGFVLLKYFNYDGFYSIETYTNSDDLFNALWQEWLKEKLIELCINTPLINLEYEQMLNRLSVKQQNLIIEAKEHFLSKARNEKTNYNITNDSEISLEDLERKKCDIVAQIFSNDLEQYNIVIKELKKLGFIMLEYFEPKANFDCAIVFTESQTMFDTLLDEWFVGQIVELRNEKHATDLDIDDFYNKLSKKDKDKLNSMKNKFVKQAMKKAPFIKKSL